MGTKACLDGIFGHVGMDDQPFLHSHVNINIVGDLGPVPHDRYMQEFEERETVKCRGNERPFTVRWRVFSDKDPAFINTIPQIPGDVDVVVLSSLEKMCKNMNVPVVEQMGRILRHLRCRIPKAEIVIVMPEEPLDDMGNEVDSLYKEFEPFLEKWSRIRRVTVIPQCPMSHWIWGSWEDRKLTRASLREYHVDQVLVAASIALSSYAKVKGAG